MSAPSIDNSTSDERRAYVREAWRCLSDCEYERIDAIKLDKAVFEATITQFASIQNDLHEIREDLRALLEHNAVCGK